MMYHAVSIIFSDRDKFRSLAGCLRNYSIRYRAKELEILRSNVENRKMHRFSSCSHVKIYDIGDYGRIMYACNSMENSFAFH